MDDYGAEFCGRAARTKLPLGRGANRRYKRTNSDHREYNIIKIYPKVQYYKTRDNLTQNTGKLGY